MGLSYILLYRHNIKIVKTTNSRCPRDPDSPSPCSCPPSWLTSSAPRRARSSPDPRWSRGSGPTSSPRSSRTPRTQCPELSDAPPSPPSPHAAPSPTRRRLLLCPWPRTIAWLLTFDQHSTNHSFIFKKY